MKAMVRDRYGSPEVLRLAEVDRPELVDGAVLVRVHATSINAHDWHMMRGKPYIARPGEGLRRPKQAVIGLDVAGVVEAVGAGVTDLDVGDRVFGSRWGAFAEYVVGRNLVPMPANLSFEEAAAVPVAGLTALQGLRDKGQLRTGESVLINGAGGGVGTFAVQIAKALGAEVTAVTRTHGVELLRSIGAHAVIDRSSEDFTRGSLRYDLILDIGGNHSLSALRRALAPGGRVVLVAPAAGQWIGPIARIVGAVLTSRMGRPQVLPFLSHTNPDDFIDLKELIESGRLRPIIDRTYPFHQVPEAIRYVESGHARGKVVITVEPSR